jgi:hypothetical protein
MMLLIELADFHDGIFTEQTREDQPGAIRQSKCQLLNFRVLKNIEVDISEDGSLDLTNDVRATGS